MARAVEAATNDPSRVVVPNTPSHRADAGQAWGTLVHGLLEHAMRHEQATGNDLRRLGMWLSPTLKKRRNLDEWSSAGVMVPVTGWRAASSG